MQISVYTYHNTIIFPNGLTWLTTPIYNTQISCVVNLLLNYRITSPISSIQLEGNYIYIFELASSLGGILPTKLCWVFSFPSCENSTCAQTAITQLNVLTLLETHIQRNHMHFVHHIILIYAHNLQHQHHLLHRSTLSQCERGFH